MDDLIYRRDAVDAIYDTFCYAYCDNCENEELRWEDDSPCEYCHRKYQSWRASRATIERAINSLPSAQPGTPSYVAEIEREYKKWVSVPHINKPLAKALYEAWKKHDREDVSRNG